MFAAGKKKALNYFPDGMFIRYGGICEVAVQKVSIGFVSYAEMMRRLQVALSTT